MVDPAQVREQITKQRKELAEARKRAESIRLKRETQAELRKRDLAGKIAREKAERKVAKERAKQVGAIAQEQKRFEKEATATEKKLREFEAQQKRAKQYETALKVYTGQIVAPRGFKEIPLEIRQKAQAESFELERTAQAKAEFEFKEEVEKITGLKPIVVRDIKTGKIELKGVEDPVARMSVRIESLPQAQLEKLSKAGLIGIEQIKSEWKGGFEGSKLQKALEGKQVPLSVKEGIIEGVKKETKSFAAGAVKSGYILGQQEAKEKMIFEDTPVTRALEKVAFWIPEEKKGGKAKEEYEEYLKSQEYQKSFFKEVRESKGLGDPDVQTFFKWSGRAIAPISIPAGATLIAAQEVAKTEEEVRLMREAGVEDIEKQSKKLLLKAVGKGAVEGAIWGLGTKGVSTIGKKGAGFVGKKLGLVGGGKVLSKVSRGASRIIGAEFLGRGIGETSKIGFLYREGYKEQAKKQAAETAGELLGFQIGYTVIPATAKLAKKSLWDIKFEAVEYEPRPKTELIIKPEAITQQKPTLNILRTRKGTAISRKGGIISFFETTRKGRIVVGDRPIKRFLGLKPEYVSKGGKIVRKSWNPLTGRMREVTKGFRQKDYKRMLALQVKRLRRLYPKASKENLETMARKSLKTTLARDTFTLGLGKTTVVSLDDRTIYKIKGGILQKDVPSKTILKTRVGELEAKSLVSKERTTLVLQTGELVKTKKIGEEEIELFRSEALLRRLRGKKADKQSIMDITTAIRRKWELPLEDKGVFTTEYGKKLGYKPKGVGLGRYAQVDITRDITYPKLRKIKGKTERAGVFALETKPSIISELDLVTGTRTIKTKKFEITKDIGITETRGLGMGRTTKKSGKTFIRDLYGQQQIKETKTDLRKGMRGAAASFAETIRRISPQQKVKDISPKIVGGKGEVVSRYYGTGAGFGDIQILPDVKFKAPKISITGGAIGVSRIDDVSPKVDAKIKTLIKIEAKPKVRTTIKTDLRIKTDVGQKVSPTTKVSSIERLGEIQRLDETQKVEQITKQKLTQKLAARKILKGKESRAKISSILKFFGGSGRDIDTGITDRKETRREGEIGFFRTFLRRRGEDIEIGKFRTQRAAEKKLSKKLKETLGASGFIERAGEKIEFGELETFGSLEFRQSKIDPFRVVQRRGKRLARRPEVFEIQRARKGGKSKAVNWLS